MDSLQNSAADGCENTAALPAIRSCPPIAGCSRGSSCPSRREVCQRRPAQPGTDFGLALLFGEWNFCGFGRVCCSRAPSPGRAVRVVFRLARGFRARRLGPQFCRLTFWSPLSQSPASQRAFLTAGAPSRPRADPPARGLLLKTAHCCCAPAGQREAGETDDRMTRSRTLELWSRHAGPAPAAGRSPPFVPTILLGAPRQMGDPHPTLKSRDLP